MNTFMKELLQIENVVDEYESYLNLSANENSMSRTARKYLSSTVADRYYFESNNNGYSDFPDFVASGNQAFDDLLHKTKHSLGEMFEVGYVNLNPLSGIHAMFMVLLTLTKAGDTVASLSPQAHGHFSTATVINRIGRKSVLLPVANGEVDITLLGTFIQETSSKMIYIDAMSYQQPFDIRAIRSAIPEDVIIVFDASHTLGLIAGGVFPNPFFEGADVICGNTHKTFPGPHRGIIFAKNQEIGDVITEKGSNLYSTVQAGTLLSLAVTVEEMRVYAKEYAAQIVNNAQTLQGDLLERGLIYTDSPLTNTHQVHIVRKDRDSAIKLMKDLKSHGVLTHVCYGDREGYYIRLGTQEITRRGMGPDEMHAIADIIKNITTVVCQIDEVIELNKRFDKIHYSFDGGVISV